MERTDKLCPFNQFKSCVGRECAFYFGGSVGIQETSASGEQSQTVEHPMAELILGFPCSITQLGMKALFDYWNLRGNFPPKVSKEYLGLSP